ncbi:16S rRNA methyltransferase [Paucilactobacillus hokkaidonensis JCM 18461]|uniref:Ribosomal RNA small subunit methyltransferase G n=2 Tax=Paucilactobacillus hokkaidonensis TaxID=1193095 RepID=A0A0A1GR64_9LACO|nr:16S rRNA (guanine(527)-N(7))-methyltransferase RsmG [Paucilactobacillus hokkaidonensis]KRO08010.1 16S rRNA methyltransferase GidB [Paucilactobacillus hokkaidonensis]BAP84787.1 16S rRNA methyltransferase [Paucilactobacillus hokkaidonensis JCM 18461]
MNPQQFRQALAKQQIMLSDQQMQQFALYYDLLVKGNEQLNLTSITEQGEVYLKHFYDSMTPAFSFPALKTDSLTLCDVGAGAGFPSLPLKIAFPNLKITIIDSLNKRIIFLEQLVAQLGLSDVTLVHDRAETFGAKTSLHREFYDVVTARAVARLSVLSELCLPLVKLNGTFIALKASQADDELAQAKVAIETLGANVSAVDQLVLPQSDEPRTIIVMNKVDQTPDKYPRRPGVPAKKPIG